MFKYVGEILEKFTTGQRVTVLIVLMCTIIIITKGVDIVREVRGLPDDVNLYIENIINEKNRLNNDLIEAKRKLVDSGIECTNTILNRELEIREEIRKLIQIAKDDENRYRRTEYHFPPAPIRAMSDNDTIQISAMVRPIEVEVNPLNSVIKELEKLENDLIKK
jgi:hypothetical protein